MITIRNFLILNFSFFILHFAFGQQYGWTEISQNLPDYPFDTTIINGGEDTLIAHISDICFINDNEGWVTTWHAFSDQNAAILHTTDGGETWEVQTVMRPCQVIHMVDENEGYAGSDGGLIFKTTDGGQNWNYFGITGAPITGMSFPPGSDTGYVCSYATSRMHRITPEGMETIDFDNAPFWWQSISAASHDLIWISNLTSVYTYDQDGLTDQPVSSDNYSSIYFKRNDLGWGCGSHGVKSRNQGTIMGCVGKNIPWIVLSYTDGPLYDVFAQDEDHVWAAGNEGYIYYSENASDFGFDTLTNTGWSDVNFVSQPNPRPDVDFLSLFFTSPQNGFASGGGNVMVKYTQITGMEAGEQGSVEVLPNPTSGIFSLQFTNYNLQSVLVEIVDLNGKVLGTWNPEPGTWNLELDISHLTTGIYFLRIYFEQIMIFKKIIKL